jgi:hypothetical protein
MSKPFRLAILSRNKSLHSTEASVWTIQKEAKLETGSNAHSYSIQKQTPQERKLGP